MLTIEHILYYIIRCSIHEHYSNDEYTVFHYNICFYFYMIVDKLAADYAVYYDAYTTSLELCFNFDATYRFHEEKMISILIFIYNST